MFHKLNNFYMSYILDADKIKARCFAEKVTATTFDTYRMRNPFASKDKFIQDHYASKLSEVYVARYLESKGKITSTPDFAVYDVSKKSYAPDLIVLQKGVKLHVKTCQSRYKSWLCQKNDPLVFNPTSYDYIVLTSYDMDFNFTLHVITSAFNVKWKDPIKPMDSKVALYLDDLYI